MASKSLSNIVIIIVLGLTTPAWALDQYLLGVCKEHYSSGNRDITNSYTSVEKARVFLSAACSIDASNYEEFRDKAKHLNSSGDTPWGLYKIRANARDNFSQFKSELRAACEKISDYDFLKEIGQVSQTAINTHVGELFNGCVSTLADYARHRGWGLVQSFTFQGPLGKRFTVHLTHSIDRRSDRLVLTDVSPSDMVQCAHRGKLLTPGQKEEIPSDLAVGQFILECARIENEKITFRVGADGIVSNELTIPILNDPLQEVREIIADIKQENVKLKNAIAAEAARRQEQVGALVVGINGELGKFASTRGTSYEGTPHGPLANQTALNIRSTECPPGQFPYKFNLVYGNTYGLTVECQAFPRMSVSSP